MVTKIDPPHCMCGCGYIEKAHDSHDICARLLTSGDTDFHDAASLHQRPSTFSAWEAKAIYEIALLPAISLHLDEQGHHTLHLENRGCIIPVVLEQFSHGPIVLRQVITSTFHRQFCYLQALQEGSPRGLDRIQRRLDW